MSPTLGRWLLWTLVLGLAGGMLFRSAWSASNLEVVPDSVEYATAGQRLATTGRYELAISGVRHPPRYPPGFPLLVLAPVYALFPVDRGVGVYPVLAFALLAIGTVLVLAARISGPWGGLCAALALLLLPEFAFGARHIMSDVPALALGLVACLLFMGTGAAAPWGRFALAGLVAAFAAAMHAENVLLVIPFAAVARRGAPRDRLIRLVALVAPMAMLGTAMALYNRAAFGSVLRSGYQYWCPIPYDYLSLMFSPRYLPANLATVLTGWPLAAAVFGAVGAALLLRRRDPSVRPLLWFLLLGVAPATAAHMVHFAAEPRFHLLLFALMSALGGAGFGGLVPQRWNTHAWVGALVALALLGPGMRAADPPPFRRMAMDGLKRLTPSDAVVITGIDPVFLAPLTDGSRREVVPIDRSVEYASKAVARHRPGPLEPPPPSPTAHRWPPLLRAGAREAVPYTADEAQDRIAAWVREGRPVFIDRTTAPLGIMRDGAPDGTFRYEEVADSPWLQRVLLEEGLSGRPRSVTVRAGPARAYSGALYAAVIR